jgi:hypothetical protein
VQRALKTDDGLTEKHWPRYSPRRNIYKTYKTVFVWKMWKTLTILKVSNCKSSQEFEWRKVNKMICWWNPDLKIRNCGNLFGIMGTYLKFYHSELWEHIESILYNLIAIYWKYLPIWTVLAKSVIICQFLILAYYTQL